MSNFSFSHSVFKRLVLQTCKKQGLFGKWLSLYHIILSFNDREEDGLRTHCEISRKCWQPAFCLFSTMFCNLSKTDIIVLTACDLPSATASSLAKILSLGKKLYSIKVATFKDYPVYLIKKKTLHEDMGYLPCT